MFLFYESLFNVILTSSKDSFANKMKIWNMTLLMINSHTTLIKMLTDINEDPLKRNLFSTF